MGISVGSREKYATTLFSTNQVKLAYIAQSSATKGQLFSPKNPIALRFIRRPYLAFYKYFYMMHSWSGKAAIGYPETPSGDKEACVSEKNHQLVHEHSGHSQPDFRCSYGL